MTVAMGIAEGLQRDIERDLDLFRCPISGERLRLKGQVLISESGAHQYRVSDAGIPLFGEGRCSPEGRQQEQHFDRLGAAYVQGLDSPQTQEYTRYLDRILLEAIGPEKLGIVAEICCGRGEAFRLLGGQIERGIGIDISVRMLERAKRELRNGALTFAQADALSLPLANACLDTVVMLGGIHHVNDRRRLFAEVFRVLRPGGRFCWREPLNDFILWRMLRGVIYRCSPALDHETEHPLRSAETINQLGAAGFAVELWRPCGLIGFCLLMNSEVLLINRAFRFLPGIRRIARGMARLDEGLLRISRFRRAGLQVVGSARRPSIFIPEARLGQS